MKSILLVLLLLPTWACLADSVASDSDNSKAEGFKVKPIEEVDIKWPEWGLAATVRNATIPYSEDFGVEDTTVTTFFPMMFYKGEDIFLRGTEGGIHILKENSYEFNAVMRNHFIDIPSSLQNAIGGDTTDYGAQFKYNWNDSIFTSVDLMTDPKRTVHSIGTIGGEYKNGNWLVQPNLSLKWRGADYNSLYYSLDGQRMGAGIDTEIGVAVRYHWFENLYLLGGAYTTYLNSNARDSLSIEEDWQSEFYLGFGFFNNVDKKYKDPLALPEYVRVAHGWATPSNIGEIIRFNREKDEFNNQLTSVFYGYPLTDELFGAPVQIYLTPGLVWHWSSEVQDSLQEAVMAIKLYYTFDWPIRTRLGVAEGISYITELTYIEQTEMDEKGYQGSEWLNFLDFSVDVNLGDLLNANSMKDVWLGYSIHHRSAIFESASQFGRIKGGSNYNTVYLQFDF